MPRRLMIGLIAAGAALLIATGAVAALLVVGGNDEDKAAARNAGSGKGYLGLTVTANPSQGLRVASIEADGPAARAGIQVGDSLRSLDGQLVRTPEQLRNAIESKAPGAQVNITFDRGDKELQASVKLTEAPADAQIEANAPSAQTQPQNPGAGGNAANRGQLGVQVQNNTPELKARYGLTRDNGLVVIQVQPNTPAAAAGVKAGDIVLTANGRPVSTVEDLTRAVVMAPAGQQIALGVLRGTDQMTLQVTLASASLFPGFENLPPALQDRLRELAQTGRYTPQQLQRLAQGNNGLAIGTVKSISETSITVTRLEQGADATYAINSSTEFRRANQPIAPGDIAVGSTVLVISPDGQTAQGIFLYQR